MTPTTFRGYQPATDYAQPLRAVLYARQSKGDASVDQQLELDAKRATERGWTIVGEFYDRSISATSGEPRPGYDEMIALVKAGRAEVIVVRHYDRLYRQPRELEGLIDDTEGVKIEAVYGGGYDLGTADGRTNARVIGAFAKGEADKKAERQIDGARRDAEAGKPRLGTPRPFGWQEDRLTRDADEGQAVADACQSLLAGGTISGIVRDWTARGLMPHQQVRRPKGAPYGPLQPRWTRTSVVTILRNPRNAGIATYKGAEIIKNGEIVRGKWDALVSEDIWRAVVRILSDHKQRRSGLAGVRTLLGGLGYCQCGNYLTSSVNHLGTHVYRCNAQTRNGQPGPHVAARASEVDRFVGDSIVGWVMKWGTDLLEPERKADTGALYAEYQEIEAANETLETDYYGRRVRMTEARFAQLHEANDRRLDEIKAQLASIERVSAVAPLVRAKDVRAAYEALPDDRKRAVIRELMDVTLRPSGRGARTFDHRRIVGISWHRDLAA